MSADELHRRILISGLLPKDRTGEDAVIAMFLSDVDLDGQFVFGENMAHLRVLHGIDDAKETVDGAFRTETRTNSCLDETSRRARERKQLNGENIYRRAVGAHVAVVEGKKNSPLSDRIRTMGGLS